MPAEQIHDFNPGIAPNGFFWTMAIPDDSFHVSHDGRRASLQLKALPMPDTFFYSNNVSVSGQVDVEVVWKATSRPVERGFGNSVPSDDPGAFIGHFSDAHSAGRIAGVETGFWFESGHLDSSGFFAEMGHEQNGVFLS